jgi:C-terminal processing protease CtpA/Prc
VVYQKPGEETEQKAVIQPVPTQRIWKNMIEPRDLDLEIREDKSMAIMTIPHFAYYRDHDKFFGFVDGSFAEIEKRGIKNLIIDLRRNNGGDPFCAVRLFAHIAHEPMPYFSKPYGRYALLADQIPLMENHFKGKLYVLIDGGGASTTGHLLGLLKYHKIGILVGEETGATYVCYDAKNSFLLKNTRFQVSVATGTFASAVQGLPLDRGILPDIRVDPTPQDMAAGKDTVLEHTLSLIQ